MNTVSMIHAVIFICVSVFGLPQKIDAAQVHSDLRNRMSQADYIIICPQQYVSIVSPLADFRALHNRFTTAIITTDAIYNIFGQGIPADSAIREFVTFAMTNWAEPKPKYFLLGGNVNAVPSHKEPGILPGLEDSIMVDQWLSEGVHDTAGYFRPAAALGRFPAWDETELLTMVNKTITYESMTDSLWQGVSLAVADYTVQVGPVFENRVSSLQMELSPVWSDTISVHVRSSSPLHRTREEFRELVNQGASIVSLIGFTDYFAFSNERYFTTWDVDSLANGNRLGLWIFATSQRFQRQDTLAISAALLKASVKGAIAALAPSGSVYFGSVSFLQSKINTEMASHPDVPIGTSILAVKRRDFPTGLDQARIMTLLGDPALVARNGITASVTPSPEAPIDFALYQNYPNPFNPSTNISFENPKNSFVDIALFNLLGQKVATIVSRQFAAGKHTISFDGRGLASGIYLYRMSAGDFSQVRRMILLR